MAGDSGQSLCSTKLAFKISRDKKNVKSPHPNRDQPTNASDVGPACTMDAMGK